MEKQEVYNSIIDIFGLVPKVPSDCSRTIQTEGIKKGYFLTKEYCGEYYKRFLCYKKFNPNSTFYKSFQDVVSKDRFELFIDQIMHYISTYGTNYQGEAYIPNKDYEDFAFAKALKILVPTSEKEIVERCDNLLYSGIALSSELVQQVINIIVSLNGEIDINKVKNREAMAILSSKLGIYPDDGVSLLRCLVYEATKETMLIKSKDLLKKIPVGNTVNLTKLSSKNLIKLSKIFYRFKPIFLKFKYNTTNNLVINKIRRLAKKYHEPMQIGFWENILATKPTKVCTTGVSNFTLIKITQAINVRLTSSNYNMYIIRNGKSWISSDNTILSSDDLRYLNKLKDHLMKTLISNLENKACRVKYPKGINLTLPASEKSFIGQFPYGTSIDLADNTYIGIYWRGEDGTDDFDLSLLDGSGKFGWNSRYHDKNIVFSGDMTQADPEATEVFYIKKTIEDSLIIHVNRYNGEEGSKYQLFIGRDNIKNFHENYMVDPNSIILKADLISNKREQSIGIVHHGKIILTKMDTSNKMVSDNGDIGKALLDRAYTYMDLRYILESAGFESVEENPDLDLTNLNKDTLINLLS